MPPTTSTHTPPPLTVTLCPSPGFPQRRVKLPGSLIEALMTARTNAPVHGTEDLSPEEVQEESRDVREKWEFLPPALRPMRYVQTGPMMEALIDLLRTGEFYHQTMEEIRAVIPPDIWSVTRELWSSLVVEMMDRVRMEHLAMLPRNEDMEDRYVVQTFVELYVLLCEAREEIKLRVIDALSQPAGDAKEASCVVED